MSETLELGGIVCMDCRPTKLGKMKWVSKGRFTLTGSPDFGYLYTIQPPVILEDGTIVYTEKCTKCDHQKQTRQKPILHQRHKRAYENVKTGEIFENKEAIPIYTTYRVKFLPVGEPYLVHNHGGYGQHPVSRKHQNHD